MTVEEFIVKWGFNVDTSKLDKAQKKIDRLNKGFKKISMASGAAIGAMSLSAAQLESKITDASTMLKKSGDEAENTEARMRKFAISMANELGLSASKVSSSFYQVLSTGAKAMSEDFKQLTETGNKLAKVAGISVAESVEKLSDVTGGFGMELKESEKVADVLFKTTKMGQTNLSQLVQAFKRAGPIASKLGVSLGTTSSMLAELANSGFKASEAGTGMRQVLTRLVAPNDRAKEAFRKLNVELYDSQGNYRGVLPILQDMKKATSEVSEETRNMTLRHIAGQEAMPRLLALMDSNIDKLKGWSKELDNTSGVIDQAFNKKMDTAIQTSLSLFNSVKNLAAILGKFFITAAKPVIEGLTEMTKKMSEFAQEHKKISQVIAALMAIVFTSSTVGVALMSIVKYITFVGNAALVAQAKALGVISLIIATIGFLILIIQDLVVAVKGGDSYLAKLNNRLDEWYAKIGGLKGLIGIITNAVADAVTWIVSKTIEGWGYIFKGLWLRLTDVWDWIKDIAGNVWGFLSNWAEKLFYKIINKFIGINQELLDKAGFLKDLLGIDSLKKIDVEQRMRADRIAEKSAEAMKNINNQNVNVGDINVNVGGDTSPDQAADIGKEVEKALDNFSEKKKREFPKENRK